MMTRSQANRMLFLLRLRGLLRGTSQEIDAAVRENRIADVLDVEKAVAYLQRAGYQVVDDQNSEVQP